MGRRAALAALVGLAIGTSPAVTQSAQVAGPTPSGATLQTAREDGTLCVRIKLARQELAETCGDPPRLVADTQVVSAPGRATQSYAGGIAPAEVVRVEAVQADGTTTDTPTRPAAGEPDASFFLLELDARRHGSLRFVRLFDASGTELGAAASDRDLPPSRPISIGRVGHMRVVAYDAGEFDPSPIDLERVRHYLCVGVRTLRGHENFASGCIGREGPSTRTLTVEPSIGNCGRGDAVIVLAQRRVARTALVLGNGRRVVAAPLELPLDPPDGRRAFVLIAPRAQALRRVEAFDAAGRRIARRQLGLEPATGACSSGLVTFGYLSVEAGPGPAFSRTPPPGGPQLAVRVDEGDRLCVGVDTAPPPTACAVPSTGAVYGDAERRYRDGSRGFAGLVDPHVAVVTAVLSDGRRVTTRTAPAPATAGPYQGVSRGYVLLAPGRAVALSYRDVDGRLLWATGVDARPEAIAGLHVALRQGRAQLAVGERRRGTLPATPCAELLTVGELPSAAACQTIDRRISTAVASCTTHRIAIFGRLGRTPRSVEAVTASGAHVPGVVDVRTRAFLIVLPAGEALRELHVLGRRGYRVRHALAPATRQCGYSATLFGSFGA